MASCLRCQAMPALSPKRHCSLCQVLRLPGDQQAAIALRCREEWVAAGSAVPPLAERKQKAEEGWAFCRGCGRWRRRDRDSIKLEVPTGSSRCRPCASTARREATYGLTPEQQAVLLALQRGLCASCRRASRDRALAVDHDHASTLPRGFLCKQCNVLVGEVHDSVDWLLGLVAYLLSPPTRRLGIGEPPLTKRQIIEEIVERLERRWKQG